MIRLKSSGSYTKATKYLSELNDTTRKLNLEYYGQKGVDALRSSTPKDTGKTADSWSYEVKRNSESISIIWSNNNINNGVNIALLLQYGHGTRNGGYVKGRDYINPAIKPIFDEIEESIAKELRGL